MCASGRGPSDGQADAIVAESRQRRAKEKEHRRASPRARFYRHAVKPQRRLRKGQVVGWKISPRAEIPREVVRRLPPASGFQKWTASSQRAIMRPQRRGDRQRHHSGRERNPFARTKKPPTPRAESSAPAPPSATTTRGTGNNLTFTMWVYQRRQDNSKRVPQNAASGGPDNLLSGWTRSSGATGGCPMITSNQHLTFRYAP